MYLEAVKMREKNSAATKDGCRKAHPHNDFEEESLSDSGIAFDIHVD